MRPTEITNDQILQAGQSLQAAGRNVTGFALRQAIGGGNPTRLRQVWDERASATAAAAAEPVVELPAELAQEVEEAGKSLAERLTALAGALNTHAVRAADRRVADLVRASAEQREQVERELADAAQTLDDLESNLDATRTEGAELARQLGDAQRTEQAQAVELAQIRERLALTEQAARGAADDHAAELARLAASAEAERKRHQEQAEQIRGELIEQKKATADAAAALDQTRGELATVKARAEAAEASHQEHRKTTAQEIHRAAERLTRTEAERDESRKQAAEAREESAHLRGQIEALQAQIEAAARKR